MPGLDVFNGSAFTLEEMTATVNKMPFVPGQAGRLPIWDTKGVTTTSVTIEEQDGQLSLIPNTPRGGVSNQNLHNRKKLRNFVLPHLELFDTVMADEVQNVRSFGTDNALAGVQQLIDDRNGQMIKKHDATLEYQRIGALKGIIYDADGSTVIYNLFTEFGVSQPQEDFDLGTTTSNIIGHATNVAGIIEDELGQAAYTGIHAFCGKTFWASFINHPNVRVAYQYFQENGQKNNPLREDLRFVGFEFGGIIWEQYRGKVGGVSFVPDAEAYAFPVGVDGLFITRFGPADFMETVNTVGLPRYSRQAPDPDGFNRYQKLLTQSNPIAMCVRPGALVKLITSS